LLTVAIPVAKVAAPVVVAVPLPTLSVPLSERVELNNIFPLTEPMEPVEETAPVNVNVPEVDVTTPPEGIVAVPATVKLNVAVLIVPVAFKSPTVLDAVIVVDVPAGTTTRSATVGAVPQLQFAFKLKSFVDSVLANVHVAAEA
jgi:hypothetical protein